MTPSLLTPAPSSGSPSSSFAPFPPVVEGEVALAQSDAFANPPIPAGIFPYTLTQNPGRRYCTLFATEF